MKNQVWNKSKSSGKNVFDFEKLVVYEKAEALSENIVTFLEARPPGNIISHQIQRASCSIMLNIAEGSGRITQKDKRHFLVIARGSTCECVAIFRLLKRLKKIEPDQFYDFYSRLTQISKMLYAMIKRLS